MKEESNNKSLLVKIERLASEQRRLQQELEELRKQVSTKPLDKQEIEEARLNEEIAKAFEEPAPLSKPTSSPPRKQGIHQAIKKTNRSDFERFIGENLISKLGVLIIIVGVGIGAKYAIDNQLISPLMRILGGYAIGAILGTIAFRLRTNYPKFSAICMSGAIAIAYFISYAAFSYYELVSQPIAFALMVVLTVGAVYTALWYKQQVIAHFGLVGAYAVPLLLSDDSGNIVILFSYLGIINLGILFISLKQYWKSLYYSSFVVTQLLYLTWYLGRYQSGDMFAAMLFSSLFFIIFYAAFLGYKLWKREEFNWTDVALLLTNAFVFYAIGYSLLDQADSNYATGLFTLINAGLHFMAFAIIYLRRRADENLQQMLIALSLIFVIIAIPVQLDGNWVTLLWVGMAAGLFYVGRANKSWIYEAISYPLIALSFFSIWEDWEGAQTLDVSLILNIHFLSTLLFISAVTLIAYLNHYKSLMVNDTLATWQSPIKIITTVILLVSVFSLFGTEINRFWDGINIESQLHAQNSMWKSLSNILLVLLIAGSVQGVNHRYWKSPTLLQVSYIIHPIILAIYLMSGLFLISNLREIGLNPEMNTLIPNSIYLTARYFSYLIFIPYMVVVYRSMKGAAESKSSITALSLVTHLSVVWVLSSELLHWADYFSYGGSYKGVLSLLWGGYSVYLIISGIKKNKVYLRIAGIVLFGVTLLKLFIYDISNLTTLSKTIIFIILGALLLVVSFIYVRFRDALWGKKEEEINDLN